MMGDGFAMTVNAILMLGQPYPGDEYCPNVNQLRPEVQFSVRKKGLTYKIYDASFNTQVIVETLLLRQPRFNLSRWYAAQRVRALSLPRKRIHPYDGYVGHALSDVARKLLTDGIHTHYPSVRFDSDLAKRFSVCQQKAVPSEYVIMDKDMKFHVWISQALLEYPSFDLVGWFIEQLAQKELCELENSPKIKQCCCE